ncbi:MAG: hypothetical protein ACXWQJ_06040, partial [Bdellovibrionota bacterium]
RGLGQGREQMHPGFDHDGVIRRVHEVYLHCRASVRTGKIALWQWLAEATMPERNFQNAR